MQLHEIGPSAGRRMSFPDGTFTLVPLIGADDVGRAVLLELAAGDAIPAHAADDRQLFCVLRGAGWVSGDDGRQVAITALQAAQWSPGERHAAGTADGMLAVAIEGSFTVAAPPIDLTTR